MKSASRAKMSRIMSKAGLLPTIKCSSCAMDVEISRMGEHVCPPAPPQLTPPPDTGDNDTGASSHNLEEEGLWPKPGRSGPPPRIDPSAANHPFLQPGEMTPANSSIGSRSLSPFSPYSSHKSPNIGNQPSPQAPPTPFGPPSPDLEITDPSYASFSNADGSDSAYPSSRGRDVSFAGMQVEENPYELVKSKESKSMMRSHQQTPSTISYGQQTQEPESNHPAHMRQMMDSRSSASSYAASSTSTRLGDFISRPSTAGSNHSSRPSLASISRGPRSHLDDAPPPVPQGGYQTYSGQAPVESSPPKRPMRMGGYGGFDSSEETSERNSENEFDNAGNQLYRSKTLPAPSDQEPPPPNQLYRSQTFPIISDEANARNQQDAPPMMPLGDQNTPTPPAQYEQYDQYDQDEQPSTTSNNDYLQPAFSERNGSDSAYSPSVYGSGNEPDTGNNFATSDTTHGLGNPYEDNAVNESNSSADSSPSEAQSGSTASTSPPSETFARRPRRQRSGADISHKRHGTVVLDPPPGFFLGNPDSPTDPSFQDGHLSNPMSKHERSFTSEEEQIEALKRQPPPVPPLPDLPSNATTPPPRPFSSSGQRKRRCRGCNEFITGKSVSSADGRLTGRYHKSCLVCHTCGSAFLTADFYVLNDHPYCSQHYHELNCSLCYSCNHGIEGQYLETDEWVPQSSRSRRHRQKFHPECFRCKTCRIVLGGDYFEWYGDVYCERDARRVAAQYGPPPPPMSPRGGGPMSRGRRQPPPSPSSGMSMSRSAGGPHSPAFPPAPMMLGAPGPRFPERRTTRLMMT